MKTAFIDWTEDSLTVYVYEKKSGRTTLIDSSSLPLDGELDSSILKSLPADGWDTVCLSLPRSILTLREQEFPFTDRDKIQSTLPYELEGILLGAVSDYVIDHIVTESYDISSKVLAVCLEKSRLKSIIDMFRSADLEPRVITSLDLRLSGGNSELLTGEAVTDVASRDDAAGNEVSHPMINLRQDELSYTGDVENFIKYLRVTALLVFLFFSILAANSFLSLISLKKENTFFAGEIQKVYRRVFPEDKKIVDADRQFKGNMNLLTKKMAALGGVPVLELLRDVAVQNNRKITLHEFNADGKNIILKGTAESFEDVEALKNEFADLFREVKVTDSGATGSKKISFTIIMQEQSA